MVDPSQKLIAKLYELRDTKGTIEIQDLDSLLVIVQEVIKDGASNMKDVKIWNDINDISSHLKKLKSELQEIQPAIIQNEHISDVNTELSAVTQQTEISANRIMDAAEKIQNCLAKITDSELAREVNNHIMVIFEACDFQDLTGQRVRKVVNHLNQIEERVNQLVTSLKNIYNETQDLKKETNIKQQKNNNIVKENSEAYYESFKNGPQNNAPDQSAIDDIFNS